MNNNLCSICNNKLNGLYCSSCGQKVTNKQATIFIIIKDFIKNIFALERSVLGTIFKLISNPKVVVDSYYKGNRYYYVSPGKLFTFSLVIFAFHLSYFETVLGLDIFGTNIKTQMIFWSILLPLLFTSSYLSLLPKKNTIIKTLLSTSYYTSCFFIIFIILFDIYELITGSPFIMGTVVYVIFVFIWNTLAIIETKKHYTKIFYIIFQIISFIILSTILLLIISSIPGINFEITA